MTTEIARLETAAPDLDRPLNLAGGLSLAEAKTIGQLFYQSGMFKDMKSGAQAVTKILAGQELGIPPMQAMQGYHVVDGQPRLSASLIGALVKRSGRYDFRPTEVNDTLASITWYQDGQPVGESTFTREEAQTAGLLTRANWKTYAEDMLFARALTRGARRYCPDVFGGAVYTLGEDAEDTADRPEPARLTLPKVNVPDDPALDHDEAAFAASKHTLDAGTVDAEADAAEEAQQRLDELGAQA